MLLVGQNLVTCLLARLGQGLALLRAVMDRNRAVLLAGVRVLAGGTVTGWHLWHGLLHVSLLREHGLAHGVPGPREGRGGRGRRCGRRCGGRGGEDVARLLRGLQHHAGLEQRRAGLGAFGRGLPRQAQVAELRSQVVLL